mmetsp:Transcript_75922/g.201420  ORF Transcript_75922/g.201420 Transcript_75922/m.201420 type:complete len:248 (-) Transcript_75922:339-1082(-)
MQAQPGHSALDWAQHSLPLGGEHTRTCFAQRMPNSPFGDFRNRRTRRKRKRRRRSRGKKHTPHFLLSRSQAASGENISLRQLSCMSFIASSFFSALTTSERFSRKREKSEPSRSAATVSAAQPGTSSAMSSESDACFRPLDGPVAVQMWLAVASAVVKSAERLPISSGSTRCSCSSLSRRPWQMTPSSEPVTSRRSWAGSEWLSPWATDFTRWSAPPSAVSAALKALSLEMPAAKSHERRPSQSCSC